MFDVQRRASVRGECIQVFYVDYVDAQLHSTLRFPITSAALNGTPNNILLSRIFVYSRQSFVPHVANG
ncbi:hypothetical protein E2C01_091557 [Portunus trituberculatus]|uniref:Uncharacterized protein n=1 Tax=Portunus trituberculatus TaxID=210409 RepID=A0A5B7JPQ0_PORTR|nr:hypothetical protein [Portunus trituberculatus]